MPDAEYLSTSAKINVNENIFVARGRELVFDGFTKVQKTSTKDEEMLPTLNEGEILILEKINQEQKFTKPPARFS